ncbi:MAG: VanZ family protein [Ignavibacteria bacterium]|nr:VanZ family protein [Ignavibacteria bacterium]
MLRFLEKRKVFLVYTPLVLYWIVLLAATSFPTISVPTTDVSDKIMHFIAYFGLGILLNLTLMFQNKYVNLKKKNWFNTIFIGSVYAALDEFHQYFIPVRSMEFLDFVADFFGLVLAVVFVLFLLRLNRFVSQ